ncbi:MAG: hypothetical protein P4L82_21250 [Ancalomicrobiaceae bacterium]|nr:hypothetical protein [Ancalomicrobiaceae bacterium]
MPDTFLISCGVLFLFGVACGTRCFGLLPEASLGERLMQHYLNARRRGLTTAQATDELRMREALVRVRNRASETTMRSPRVGHDAIRWAIEKEADQVEPRIRRQFVAWASGLASSDILTKQAFEESMRITKIEAAEQAMMNKWWGGEKSKEQRRDLDAALRVK